MASPHRIVPARRRISRLLNEAAATIPTEPPAPQDEAAFEAIAELRAKMRMLDAWLGGSRLPAVEPDLSF